MKAFQIWVDYGKAIPPRSLAAMRETMARADHYTLIAESNFLDAPDFRPYGVVEAEAMQDSRVRDMFLRKNKWCSLDVLRVWFLWKNPEYTYLDADLRLLKPLETRPDKPAFARYDKGIDGFLIQGNGHGQHFNALLSAMHRNAPGHNQCFPMIASLPPDWDNVIEGDYFEHFNQNQLKGMS